MNQPYPQPGSPAPDFSALDTSGNTVQLSELWTDSPLVVVFLRHLGCTFCREHVLRLRSQYAAFKEAGADVVCVAMGSPNVGKAFQITFNLPYTMLMTGDGDTSVYKLYGLGKGSLWQLFGPNMVLKGFRALFTLGPKVIGRLQGDGHQMPGTFIIDRSGTIRLAYRSKDAADNPSNKLLLDTLYSLQGGVPLENDTRVQPSAPTG